MWTPTLRQGGQGRSRRAQGNRWHRPSVSSSSRSVRTWQDEPWNSIGTEGRKANGEIEDVIPDQGLRISPRSLPESRLADMAPRTGRSRTRKTNLDTPKPPKARHCQATKARHREAATTPPSRPSSTPRGHLDDAGLVVWRGTSSVDWRSVMLFLLARVVYGLRSRVAPPTPTRRCDKPPRLN